MISVLSVSKRFRMEAVLALSLLFLGPIAVRGAVINAQSVSRADVGAAVTAATDGDVVMVPSGSATWQTTLTVTKNIEIIGAGEGVTIITENLSRTGNPPLFSVSLNHESAAPAYSFRLSGMTLKSANSTPLAADHGFISLVGLSNPAAVPPPHVAGCVSRVRIDHMTWDNLNGIAIIVDSCLGVADHITQITATSVYQSYPIKVFMNNWTPAVNPATGSALPKTYLAQKGFGSWADDPYWGTDKFWFFEDCNFTCPTQLADDEEGGRVVFRHCTINGGFGISSHGMEGRANPGVKQEEVYNNYFNTDRLFAQLRSGSALYFNNKSTAMSKGMAFHIYRQTRTVDNWGAASGDNRYDNNAVGGPLYTGTVTAMTGTSSDGTVSSITDSNQSNFNSIDLTDGSLYAVNDLDDPSDVTKDAGWKYFHNTVSAVSGKTLSLQNEVDGPNGQYCAHWRVGHRYEIRKVLAAYGQPGQGKGDLLNTIPTDGSYSTYTYPATSGAKATYPQAGYPLEPCYSWNNTDDKFGYLGFNNPDNTSLKEGRDYIDLPERSVSAQNVGYPPQVYSRATSNYPNVGAGQTVPYTPFTYPHPLTTDGGGTPPGAPSDLHVVQ
jgi:hypothetical protein